MLRCCAFLAALILVGFATFEAHADRRVAFVIGNSQYRNIPALKNPDTDAKDVSKTFRLAGFDVFVAKDVTKLQFEEQFRNYLAAADGADLAVVYYSGHGFQIGGVNFLIPVDASLKQAADIEVQAIKLDDMLEQLRSKSKIQIIILDACRNNPFPRKDYWLRDQLITASGTGLAEVKSSQNALIAFATGPDAIAYDGTGNASPFSSAFSRRALAPNQEIRAVMAAVRRDVVAATKGKQVPWENSSLIDEVVLMHRANKPALPPVLERVVPSGIGPVALDLPTPVTVDGSAVTVSFETLPALAGLVLDGKPVAEGDQIAGNDLPRLLIDLPKASDTQEQVETLAYATHDEWGGVSQGILVLRIKGGAEGQQSAASLKAEQKQLMVERGLHITGAAEAIQKKSKLSVPVGVGPVPLNLDFPTGDPGISLKLASYPATGTLSLPDRTLSPDSTILANEIDKLRYEPQIGAAAPLELGFQIRAGKASKPATVKLSPSVDPCDRAAGAPLDLQGVAPGRQPNEIGGGAIEACEAAVKAYPNVVRFRYELGRALLAAGKVDEARKAIQEAADKGHARAVFELAYMAASATSTAADVTKANGLYAQAADQGDPAAMAAWGRALFNGVGVEPNPRKGLDLLLKSAAMGHISAMNDLALIFQEGRNGVPADPARALAFLKASMERQEVYSMSILGLAGRRFQTAAVCKPKVITKIRVIRAPAPPMITPPPVKPVPPLIEPAPWRGGSSGDRPSPSRQSSTDDSTPDSDTPDTPDSPATGEPPGTDASTTGFGGISTVRGG
ncbi:MAG: peptidase C14 caspase catalytic subunit p20 [Mesorhizobium sp.]|uniref:caspase family protein n=5 Tax=Mesorhizobium TaxID=68287 RepID=UPI000F74E012|nr:MULTISPECIES: caspase family protein [unclassified Mesorhizobium]RVC75578.1 peptidase C14 caspase catalytic subunit p20 [Mesorhizobium sp. M2A.F.Ca.ET.046.02.1.1]AZO36230.1 peptidase C14 caspase catalytic subunit p20 [Mesorhizobium sp. M2A.F.Ca.ET.046.03.2.1]RWA80619.1 MAG: peptidase C14 caspase catalytic subunit p20 [Mesorhizobium sp.]RWB45567.1 MAG: peptidase C14 caspase catalytic subunit p20 [Mesorhizobium sp.]TIV18987.1 MAG: peptidase C14 caspase catalytic subunit p20 [Mesorhizobium sp.